jgi:hypothetical protein
MKLWLDDVRTPPTGPDGLWQSIRCKFAVWFDLPLVVRHRNEWIWVKTAAQATRMLETHEVERISLDHDLGDEKAESGYDVASWIEWRAADGTLPRLQWDVHSMNAVGRGKITEALRSANRYWDLRERQNICE